MECTRPRNGRNVQGHGAQRNSEAVLSFEELPAVPETGAVKHDPNILPPAAEQSASGASFELDTSRVSNVGEAAVGTLPVSIGPLTRPLTLTEGHAALVVSPDNPPSYVESCSALLSGVSGPALVGTEPTAYSVGTLDLSKPPPIPERADISEGIARAEPSMTLQDERRRSNAADALDSSLPDAVEGHAHRIRKITSPSDCERVFVTRSIVPVPSQAESEFFRLIKRYQELSLKRFRAWERTRTLLLSNINLEKSVWQIERRSHEERQHCRDGNTVVHTTEFDVATYSPERAVALADALAELREASSTEYVAHSYNSLLARQQTQLFLEEFLSSSFIFSSLHPSGPVVAVPPSMQDPGAGRECATLRDYIGVLFFFEKEITRRRREQRTEVSADTTAASAPEIVALSEFRQDVRKWLRMLVSALLRRASHRDHHTLLVHVLACRGVSEWAGDFVQFPAAWRSDDIPYFEEALRELLRPRMYPVVPADADSSLSRIAPPDGDDWVFLGSESSSQEEEMPGEHEFVLAEEDFMVLFDQFPTGRYLQYASDVFAARSDLLQSSLRLLRSCELLVDIISSAFGVFSSYRHFLKRLGGEISGIVECGIAYSAARLAALSSEAAAELQLAIDALVLRAVRSFLWLRSFGVWQFLVDLPYQHTRERTAWRVLYALFRDRLDDSTTSGGEEFPSSPKDWLRLVGEPAPAARASSSPVSIAVLDAVDFAGSSSSIPSRARSLSPPAPLHPSVGSTLARSPPLAQRTSQVRRATPNSPLVAEVHDDRGHAAPAKSVFEKFVEGLSRDTEAEYLLYALERLASRGPPIGDVVVRQLFLVAFVARTRAALYKTGGCLLYSSCLDHPEYMSVVIAMVNRFFSGAGTLAKYAVRSLPLHLWVPSLERDLPIIESWLLHPPDSEANALGRAVLSALDWGYAADSTLEGSLPTLYLPHEVHRWVAVMIVRVYSHCQDWLKRGRTSRWGSGGSAAAASAQAFREWCWGVILLTKLRTPSFCGGIAERRPPNAEEQSIYAQLRDLQEKGVPPAGSHDGLLAYAVLELELSCGEPGMFNSHIWDALISLLDVSHPRAVLRVLFDAGPSILFAREPFTALRRQEERPSLEWMDGLRRVLMRVLEIQPITQASAGFARRMWHSWTSYTSSPSPTHISADARAVGHMIVSQVLAIYMRPLPAARSENTGAVILRLPDEAISAHSEPSRAVVFWLQQFGRLPAAYTHRSTLRALNGIGMAWYCIGGNLDTLLPLLLAPHHEEAGIGSLNAMYKAWAFGKGSPPTSFCSIDVNGVIFGESSTPSAVSLNYPYANWYLLAAETLEQWEVITQLGTLLEEKPRISLASLAKKFGFLSTIGHLVIYKWLYFALYLDPAEPLLPLFFQAFFCHYFVHSASNFFFGHYFLDIAVKKTSLRKRLIARLNKLALFHTGAAERAAAGPDEVIPVEQRDLSWRLSVLYSAMSTWLAERDPAVVASNLATHFGTDSFQPLRLISVINESVFHSGGRTVWRDLVPTRPLAATLTRMISSWFAYSERTVGPSAGARESSRPGQSTSSALQSRARSSSMNERDQFRTRMQKRRMGGGTPFQFAPYVGLAASEVGSSWESETPFSSQIEAHCQPAPEFVFSPPHVEPPALAAASSALDGDLNMLCRLAKEFASRQQEHAVLDQTYMHELAQLYSNELHAMAPVQARCELRMRCNGPALFHHAGITHPVVSSAVRARLEQNRRDAVFLLDNPLSVTPEICTASLLVSRTVDRLIYFARAPSSDFHFTGADSSETVDIHAEGSRLFYALARRYALHTEEYPPTQALLGSAIIRLGEDFIRGRPHELVHLLQVIFACDQTSHLPIMLASLFDPLVATGCSVPPVDPDRTGDLMLWLFEEIVLRGRSKLSPSVLATIARRFPFNRWLQLLPPAGSRSRLMDCLSGLLSEWNRSLRRFSPLTEELQFHIQLLQALVAHEFPFLFGKALVLLTEGSRDGALPRQCWSAVSSALVAQNRLQLEDAAASKGNLEVRKAMLESIQWLVQYCWARRTETRKQLLVCLPYVKEYLELVDAIMGSPFLIPRHRTLQFSASVSAAASGTPSGLSALLSLFDPWLCATSPTTSPLYLAGHEDEFWDCSAIHHGEDCPDVPPLNQDVGDLDTAGVGVKNAQCVIESFVRHVQDCQRYFPQTMDVLWTFLVNRVQHHATPRMLDLFSAYLSPGLPWGGWTFGVTVVADLLELLQESVTRTAPECGYTFIRDLIPLLNWRAALADHGDDSGLGDNLLRLLLFVVHTHPLPLPPECCFGDWIRSSEFDFIIRSLGGNVSMRGFNLILGDPAMIAVLRNSLEHIPSSRAMPVETSSSTTLSSLDLHGSLESDLHRCALTLRLFFSALGSSIDKIEAYVTLLVELFRKLRHPPSSSGLDESSTSSYRAALIHHALQGVLVALAELLSCGEDFYSKDFNRETKSRASSVVDRTRVFRIVSSILALYNCTNSETVAIVSAALSEFITLNPDCAMDVMQAACQCMAGADILAQFCEFCLNTYFSVGGCTRWAPCVEAMLIPELDQAEFVGHCLSRGCTLTLAVCGRKQFEALLSPLGRDLASPGGIPSSKPSFGQLSALANHLVRWVSAITLIRGREHYCILLWALLLDVLKTEETLFGTSGDEQKKHSASCQKQLVARLQDLATQGSGRFLKTIRFMSSKGPLPPSFQFAAHAFVLYVLSRGGDGPQKGFKHAQSAFERLPIRNEAFNTPEFRSCYGKVIEFIQDDKHSDSECYDFCYIVASRLYPEANVFVNWR